VCVLLISRSWGAAHRIVDFGVIRAVNWSKKILTAPQPDLQYCDQDALRERERVLREVSVPPNQEQDGVCV